MIFNKKFDTFFVLSIILIVLLGLSGSYISGKIAMLKSPMIHSEKGIDPDKLTKILSKTKSDFDKNLYALNRRQSEVGYFEKIMILFRVKNHIYISKSYSSENKLYYEVLYRVNYDMNFDEKRPLKYVIDDELNIIEVNFTVKKTFL